MNTSEYKTVATLVEMLEVGGAWRAVKYLTPKRVIRATARLNHGRPRRKTANVEVLITIGRPNYRERQFIATCLKAGEPFPVRKVALQFPPKRKKS